MIGQTINLVYFGEDFAFRFLELSNKSDALLQKRKHILIKSFGFFITQWKQTENIGPTLVLELL